MDLTAFNKRILNRNPLHPYSWQASYKGGGRLKQFDFDGQHFSPEINRSRVTELVILGHPDSPITIPIPYPDRVPDEVIIKAQVSLRQTLGVPGMTRTVRLFFGYRYGAEKFLLEIDEQGKLWKTNNEEQGGVIVPGEILGQIAQN